MVPSYQDQWGLGWGWDTVRVIGPIVMVSELSVCSSAVRKNMQLVIIARNSVAMHITAHQNQDHRAG